MPRDRERLNECRALQDELRRHATLAALQRSPGWPALDRRLERVLSEVHVMPAPVPSGAAPQPSDAPAASAATALRSAAPARAAPLRAVHWNIEHGNRFEQVLGALTSHPQLAGADLVMLNEVDLGMARAGNRNVTAELAAALGMHGAFAPLFIETTLGRDDDVASAAGRDNQEGLFGIAILSRHPFGALRVIPLPSPIRIQFEGERMWGRHVALAATIERPGAPFTAVSVHLEVHRTRRRRADQMRALVGALASIDGPVVLAGDFNSHTFDRGRPFDRLHSALVLTLSRSGALRDRLRHPDRGAERETLFDELARGGFEWERFNDRESSLALRFERLEEVATLPRPLDRLAPEIFRWAERRAQLRLDWFAGRGWRGGRGFTVPGLDGPGRASDHAPIVAELEPPGPAA